MTIQSVSATTDPAKLELHNRRSSPRHPVWIPVSLFTLTNGGSKRNAIIVDLSDDGAKLQIANAHTVPKYFQLMEGLLQNYYECETRWAQGGFLGLRFIDICSSSRRRLLSAIAVR